MPPVNPPSSLAYQEAHPPANDLFNLPLEQREELFVSVMESLFDGVIVTNPQGRVLYLNPSMERTSGWPRAEVQGKPFWEVFLDPADWLHDQRRLQGRAAGKSEEYEIEARRKDGQRRIWRLCATPVSQRLTRVPRCHRRQPLPGRPVLPPERLSRQQPAPARAGGRRAHSRGVFPAAVGGEAAGATRAAPEPGTGAGTERLPLAG